MTLTDVLCLMSVWLLITSAAGVRAATPRLRLMAHCISNIFAGSMATIELNGARVDDIAVVFSFGGKTATAESTRSQAGLRSDLDCLNVHAWFFAYSVIVINRCK